MGSCVPFYRAFKTEEREGGSIAWVSALRVSRHVILVTKNKVRAEPKRRKVHGFLDQVQNVLTIFELGLSHMITC